MSKSGYGYDRPILISYPCMDTLHSDFCQSLAMLATYSVGACGYWIGISQTRGSIICASRNLMIHQALTMGQGPSHILMLDSDMIVPMDLLWQLLSHNVQVVGATYCMRLPPHALTHRNLDGSSDFKQRAGIYEVASMGLGCCLLDLEVLRSIYSTEKPIFSIKYSGAIEHTGEDISFFNELRSRGIPVHLDVDVSKQIRHVGLKQYGLEDVKKTYSRSEAQSEVSVMLWPEQK